MVGGTCTSSLQMQGLDGWPLPVKSGEQQGPSGPQQHRLRDRMHWAGLPPTRHSQSSIFNTAGVCQDLASL